MNEVGLGAPPRKAVGPVRRWQDELPEATVALLAGFGNDIVRSGQNSEDSANDYRGYVAQALVLLGEGTAWPDLDSNVKSGCRSFMRWAKAARPGTSRAAGRSRYGPASPLSPHALKADASGSGRRLHSPVSSEREPPSAARPVPNLAPQARHRWVGSSSDTQQPPISMSISPASAASKTSNVGIPERMGALLERRTKDRPVPARFGATSFGQRTCSTVPPLVVAAFDGSDDRTQTL